MSAKVKMPTTNEVKKLGVKSLVPGVAGGVDVALGFSPLPDLPIGATIMWYCAAGSIPENWQICDGTNGTPDMRGAFL